VQRLREGDVRTLHRLQLGVQRVLVGRGLLAKWLFPKMLPLLLNSPLVPLIQRRIFFGAPLPPLDPAFSFREAPSAAGASTR
jgi:hypothetical protein